MADKKDKSKESSKENSKENSKEGKDNSREDSSRNSYAQNERNDKERNDKERERNDRERENERERERERERNEKDDDDSSDDRSDDKSDDHEGHQPCYTKGTLIATKQGERLIEDLVPGDMLLTVSGEYAPLKWVGHRKVNCTRLTDPTNAWPILMKQGSFGNGLPKRDLYLSPLHSVYVDTIFIPAVDLINDLSITQEQVAEVTYYHLELPAHNVIYAEGLPAESYLADHNRNFFISTAADSTVDFAAEFSEEKTSEEIWQQQGFTTVLRSGSPEVEKIKADLLTHADELLNSKLAA